MLQLIPIEVPLLVVHDAIPVLVGMARNLGMRLKEASAIMMKPQELKAAIHSVIQTEGVWLILDLADILDFGALFLELRAFNVARLAWSAQIAETAPQSYGKTLLSSSRLVLFSSSESALVPRYIIWECFRVQNAVRFFGIHREVSHKSITMAVSDADENESSSSNDPASSGDDELKTRPRRKPSKTRKVSAEVLRAGSEFVAEVIGFLSFTHPLLTAKAMAMHDQNFMIFIRNISESLTASSDGHTLLQDVMSKYRRVENVTDWVAHSIVRPAESWVERSSLRSLIFHGFSPALLKQNEREARDTLRAIVGKLTAMLHRVSARAYATSSADLPFWLRVELDRASKGIRSCRADLLACHGALLGDVHWNPRLFKIYTDFAHGQAVWANGRPLAVWLASLQEHVQFLASWKLGETAPIRIGSVVDLSSLFLQSSGDAECFHFRLEMPAICPTIRHDPFARRNSRLGPASSSNPIGATKSNNSRKTRSVAQARQTSASRLSERTLSNASESSLNVQEKREKSESSPNGSGDQPSLEEDRRDVLGGGFLVEGLRVVGGICQDARIVEGAATEYEAELPSVLLQPMRGAPPRSADWFACPLLIAHMDEYGQDLAGTPIATVYIRTSVNPALCAVRGVRLVSYA